MREFCLKKKIHGNIIDTDLLEYNKLTACGRIRQPLFSFISHSARAHREVRPTNAEHIKKSLSTLVVFSNFMKESGIEWYLTGGIAIDLVKKSSFRLHGDLDIVLSIDEAPKLAKFLKDRCISAYRRVCTATYQADRRVTLFKRAIPSHKIFGKMRNLKLLTSPNDSLLPFVDIHFVKQANIGNSLLADKKVISLPFPLKGREKFIINGNTIHICDLRLILYLKSDNNPRNFYDAQRLASLLPKHEVEQVMELRAANSGQLSLGHLLSQTPHMPQIELPH